MRTIRNATVLTVVALSAPLVSASAQGSSHAQSGAVGYRFSSTPTSQTVTADLACLGNDDHFAAGPTTSAASSSCVQSNGMIGHTESYDFELDALTVYDGPWYPGNFSALSSALASSLLQLTSASSSIIGTLGAHIDASANATAQANGVGFGTFDRDHADDIFNFFLGGAGSSTFSLTGSTYGSVDWTTILYVYSLNRHNHNQLAVVGTYIRSGYSNHGPGGDSEGSYSRMCNNDVGCVYDAPSLWVPAFQLLRGGDGEYRYSMSTSVNVSASNWGEDEVAIDLESGDSAQMSVVIGTPEPGSLALLATGLFSVVGVSRRRRASPRIQGAA